MPPKTATRPTPPDRKRRSSQPSPHPRKTTLPADATTTTTTTSSSVMITTGTAAAAAATARTMKTAQTKRKSAVTHAGEEPGTTATPPALRVAKGTRAGAATKRPHNTGAETTPGEAASGTGILPDISRRPVVGSTPTRKATHSMPEGDANGKGTATSSPAPDAPVHAISSKGTLPARSAASDTVSVSPHASSSPHEVNETGLSNSPGSASPPAHLSPPAGALNYVSSKGILQPSRPSVSPPHKPTRAAGLQKDVTPEKLKKATVSVANDDEEEADDDDDDEDNHDGDTTDDDSSSSDDDDDDDEDDDDDDSSDEESSSSSDDEDDDEDDDDDDDGATASDVAGKSIGTENSSATEREQERKNATARKKATLKKVKGISSSRRKLLTQARILVKVSREGDRNVKMLHVCPYQSLFSDFVAQIMGRFDFKNASDFDLFCIDRSGERVDIDLDEDFEELLEPYRAYLATLDDTALAETKHRRGVEATGNKATNVSAMSPTFLRSPSVSPSGVSVDAASPLGLLTPADDETPVGLPSIALVEPLEGSSATVIRLYVRDSYAFRKQTQIMGMSHLSQTDMIGSRTMASTAAVSECGLGRSSQSPGALLGLLADTPDSISLQFAETQRSALGKTFTFSEKEELQWSKLRTLGKGSFGTVYEGMTADGKTMAVKVQELPLDEDAEESKALQKEINLMRMLKHKNIVAYYGCQTKVLDSGATEMEIFMELCHGGSLSTLRRKFEKANERFSISLVRAYTRQILEGLQYLHASNVMHRDIKSDNVLISAVGEAKLADFGCSKRLTTTATVGEVGGAATAQGTASSSSAASSPSGANAALYQTMVGSPLFMAPEVMLDDGTGYSFSADVWSVGCLVLELLGRPPWKTGNSNNVFQLMYQIAHAKGMPTGVPTNCPGPLLDFFQHCFQRDAKKRATAEALLSHPWITCPDNRLEEVPPEPEGAASP